jgi:hypothetical protein
VKASLIIYRDQAHEWRWRLRLGNGRIIADSGEGYKSRKASLYAARRLRVWVAVAEIEAA